MDREAIIREHNDAFRQSLTGGLVLVSLGVYNSGLLTEALERVKSFTDFNAAGKKYHEFGTFTVDNVEFQFHVDCYCDTNDEDVYESLNILEPELTHRTLTLKLRGEG